MRSFVVRLRERVRLVLSSPPRETWRKVQARRVTPRPGRVRFGHLRRTTPIARDWGYGRGGPVDRYYIERFLDEHRADIHGRVLEIGDDAYTRRFGGDRVRQRDVLHIDDVPGATFVGDLADGRVLPDAAFDCVLLTQTLHLVFDFPAALRTIDRVLRPGGVLLLTVPGITPIDAGEWGSRWYYSFSHHALARMCDEFLDGAEVTIVSYGNALSAVAFLHGLSARELTRDELDRHEVTHSILNVARVRKGSDGA